MVKAIKSASHGFMNQVKLGKNKIQKDASTFAAKPNPQKPQIYSTVDGGKLHLAVDEHYRGAIDGYNNPVSQLFAKWLGWSVEVTINNKVRYLSKSEFMKWLNSNTAYADVSEENLKNFCDLQLLDVKAAEGSLGRMRDHLSPAKTQKLFEKMVLALSVDKDSDAAKKYAGKGAAIDTYYWVRDKKPVSFTTIKNDLAEAEAVEFRAGRLTVLHFAAEQGLKSLCEFLKKLGANQSLQGEYVLFSRKIVKETLSTEKEKVEEHTASNGRLISCLTLKTTTTYDMEDHITPKVDCRFVPESNGVVKVESKAPVTVEKYSTIRENCTTHCR